MTRKLVTVRRVDAVNPIDGADAIECLTVEGWKVVSQKGNFKQGDLAVYFEIDSFLPDGNSLWQDLVDKSSREFEGRKGHVLRTVKLRGQVSQGFCIPLRKFPDIESAVMSACSLPETPIEVINSTIRDIDWAEQLGVVKYEPPIPAALAGAVKGLFPSFIRKTDQERVQNLPEVLHDLDAEYEVTVKLDGSSMTVFARDGEVGVCSRNLELKISDENKDNTLIRVANESGLLAAIKSLGGNYAVQGELMGPGVQGNRENLKAHNFFVFDIFDIDAGEYVSPAKRAELFMQLFQLTDGKTVNHVPVIYTGFKLSELQNKTLDGILEFAEGPSLTNPIREGLVFKRLDGKFSFKAISNRFLLKAKD